MVDKNTLNRVAQLEAAQPAYEEPPRITPGMGAATAMKVYKQTLNWPMPPAKPLTPEEQARLDRMTPEEATAAYRASIGLPPEDEPAPAPVVEPDPEAMTPEDAVQCYRELLDPEPDPLGWLDDAERNGPPDDDEYSDLPQEAAPEPDEQPEPTPTPVPLASQPDADDWLLY